MRSRIPQVDRIDDTLRARIPCYRSPAEPDGDRVGADGKLYPAGERWDWRRIALRREAVAAILEVAPDASVRVVRDVLGRYGHRVGHEQVRHDMATRVPGSVDLTESRRWLSLDAWRDETDRRRRERRRADRAAGARIEERSPTLIARRDAARAGTVRPPPERPPDGRRDPRRDDWAVWDDAPRARPGVRP